MGILRAWMGQTRLLKGAHSDSSLQCKSAENESTTASMEYGEMSPLVSIQKDRKQVKPSPTFPNAKLDTTAVMVSDTPAPLEHTRIFKARFPFRRASRARACISPEKQLQSP